MRPIGKLVVALFAAVAVAAIPAATLAKESNGAGAITETNHVHKQTNTFFDIGLCGHDGESWEITETINSVEHLTTLANGTSWETFTATGTVNIHVIDTPLIPADPNDPGSGLIPENSNYGVVAGSPTYSGRYTIWDNFNQNLQNWNSTFTFNVRLRGSDGSVLSLHENAHAAMTPNGVEFWFDKPNCA